ncbi:Ger(x)C family spore germination protein [Pelosinus sp. sgz500959]|uniref:Ger(x)C family spore germination protein n=1 Tax=Pelosinus sp. sgz500959 TaxID=3242472 RepID=UPI0036715ED5
MRIFTLSIWYKPLLGCILIVTISLFSSGCWDQRDLEDRRLILAIAVDRADEQLRPAQGNEVARVETFVQPHGRRLYRLSLQILDIVPSKGTIAGPQGQIGSYVISNTGESIFEMTRDMLGQVDQSLWFEYVQTIIISEDVARQGDLRSLIDFFRRDREMRQLTKILITSGEARSLLEYQSPGGEPSGIFIANSLRLYRKNVHVPGWGSNMRDLSQSIDNKRRVLMTRIELVDNVVKLGGMALFKEGKFIGYVDEYATKGGQFLSGLEKSAIITAECPEHPGKILAFELFHHDTKLTPHLDGENIYYTLDIAMSGNLGETQCGREHHMIDNEEVHKIEELVAEEVKRNVLYTFHTYQSLKVDGSNFNEKLKAHEPLMWEKVKDRWDDEIFPHISLLVSVNVVIDNIGEHK